MALNLQDIFASTYFFGILVLFLVLYGPRLSPRLPESIRSLFNSQVFRALVIFLVIYSSNRQLGLVMSLTIVIIFMVLLNIIQTKNLLESFQQENFEVQPWSDPNVGAPSPISCSTYDMAQANFVGAPFYPLNDRNNLGGEPLYNPQLDYSGVVMDKAENEARILNNEASMLQIINNYKTMF